MSTDVEGIDIVAERVYQDARAWRNGRDGPVAQFSWYLPPMEPVLYEEAADIATYVNGRTGGDTSDFVASPVRLGYTNQWRVSIDRR